MDDAELAERARRRKEERERRERELEEELKRWEEERKQRIAERRAKRAAAEQEIQSAPANSTAVAGSDAVASKPDTSSRSQLDATPSDAPKSRTDSVKAVEDNLLKWEEERAAKVRQREEEAAARRRQLEEQIQKEEEERKARLEQRRKEREERRKAEEAEEKKRQEEREAERQARKKAQEEEMKKLEAERVARAEARRKALEEAEAAAAATKKSSDSSHKKKDHTASSTDESQSHHHSKDHKDKAVAKEKSKHKDKDKHKDKSSKDKSKGKQPVQEIPASKFGNIKTTERPIKSVQAPVHDRLDVAHVFILPDLNDPEGKKKLPDPDLLRDHFAKEGRLTRQCVRSILMAAREVLLKEKNVVTIQAPVVVVGDIHGQYFDMLHLLQRAGKPGEEKKYVFLGDYVDRGTFSCEVTLYLLSVKINYPDRVMLLRGNHETRSMALYHNFNSEAKSKYGEPIFDLFEDVFDALPLACIVETPGMGNFFCCHGGLSPDIKTIDDINGIDRVQEPPDDGPLCDLIWSDPIHSDTAPNQNFIRNKERSVSWVYGYNPLIDFLEENKLTSIIRAHQVKETGYEEHKFSQTPPERQHPLCITVFSAPNYCDSYQNTAAYLEINDEEYNFVQFTWQDHPYVLPDFSDGFRFSMPFVSENLMKFILDILELVDSTEDTKEDQSDAEEKKAMDEKMKNVGKAFLLLQRKRTENQLKLRKLGDPESPSTPTIQSGPKRNFASMVKRVQEENSRFSAAKKADEDNEKLHRDDDLKAKVLASKKRSLRNLTAGIIQRNNIAAKIASPKVGK
eukprot:TRINITY_DN4402_c0_g1_i2.p1 TRINITY_DN4402_c0_g1~~TRINITY_DN4402_c0_g1_i2.p1  ORF type:complete len:797 (+),score=246.92 TRINITY_DN4402_c0_g1_i2:221-2611(+)